MRRDREDYHDPEGPFPPNAQLLVLSSTFGERDNGNSIHQWCRRCTLCFPAVPPMKAFILAAGKGTRLQPLTETLPKVLMPVLGVPMLDRLVAGLKRHGATEIALNTHHLAEAVERHIRAVYRSNGSAPRRFHEPELLGTGGALANTRDWWDQPVLLWNGDILAEVDVPALHTAHRARGAEATLVVSSRRASSHLQVDGDGWVCGIHSPRRNLNRVVRQGTGALQNRAYHGVALFNPGLVRRMARPGAYDLIEALLQAIAEGARVAAFEVSGLWGTTGTMTEWQALEEALRQNPRALAWFTP
jgi:NDP-sugar pyrophosphorylase family protein